MTQQNKNQVVPFAEAAAVQAISDTVSEREGKIVVTTTISLDRSALSETGSSGVAAPPRPAKLAGTTAFDPLSEVVAMANTAGSAEQDALSALTNSDTYHRMQEAVSDGRITMLQMSPRVYLGLVSGRRRMRAHPLAIGDSLFIFVSRNSSLTSMAELIAQLLNKLPQETSWRTPEGAAHIEQIADALNRAGTRTMEGRR